MGYFTPAAVLAAGFAPVVAARRVLAADGLPSLQSFGASRVISAYELSAPGLSGGAVEPAGTEALGSNLTLAGPSASSFASSAVLAPNLALAFGKSVDIAARFTNYNGTVSPFLSSLNTPYLALA